MRHGTHSGGMRRENILTLLRGQASSRYTPSAIFSATTATTRIDTSQSCRFIGLAS
jgi:hypothetical protein